MEPQAKAQVQNRRPRRRPWARNSNATPRYAPYLGGAAAFLSGYAGLAISIAPHAIPYRFTFREAAAADNALGFLLVGVAVLLPVILAYTAYVYWVFRGKASVEHGY